MISTRTACASRSTWFAGRSWREISAAGTTTEVPSVSRRVACSGVTSLTMAVRSRERIALDQVDNPSRGCGSVGAFIQQQQRMVSGITAADARLPHPNGVPVNVKAGRQNALNFPARFTGCQHSNRGAIRQFRCQHFDIDQRCLSPRSNAHPDDRIGPGRIQDLSAQLSSSLDGRNLHLHPRMIRSGGST